MNPKGTPANLKPWKPGQSGNPKGRPKGRGITDALIEALTMPVDKGDPDGETVAERMAALCVKYASEGKFPFFKELLERVEGKVPQGVELASDDQRPLRLILSNGDGKGTVREPGSNGTKNDPDA